MPSAVTPVCFFTMSSSLLVLLSFATIWWQVQGVLLSRPVVQAGVGEWLNHEDSQQLASRRCAVLFWHGGEGRRCSCADAVLADIEQRQEAIYADADFRVVRDPKMAPGAGLLGLHYTAWSLRPELRTVADAAAAHVPALELLREAAAGAIAARHPGLSSSDLSAFLHFPPNIFRLHVHFVHRNATMWAPSWEVVPLRDALRLLRAGAGGARHFRPSLLGRCSAWD
mmetsp:Transcript_9170/g.24990  ORF Transcript_9170/g.24990 Transcript_9170/m.24990 type:complete len:226 (+) Transcript_9170:82-759(+)